MICQIDPVSGVGCTERLPQDLGETEGTVLKIPRVLEIKDSLSEESWWKVAEWRVTYSVCSREEMKELEGLYPSLQGGHAGEIRIMHRLVAECGASRTICRS